jgi:carotenoid cleavage dioxygenase
MPGMSIVHDMSLTGRYAVVYDQPVTVDLDLAFAGRFPFRWNADYGNRVGLLPREGSAADITWVDVPLCYSYHPLNAYDAPDGSVVIDLCVYDKMFDNDILGPFGDGLARLERWVINPMTRTMSATVIDASPNEFPRHRGAMTAKPYRYGYCASPNIDDPRAGWPTLKHDLVTGARIEFDHGPGRAAGEPVFVSRPGSTDEDDGWLVTLVHDLTNDGAELVVLDAQDFDRGYVGQVPLPQRVPFGFHGNWVSDRSVGPESRAD